MRSENKHRFLRRLGIDPTRLALGILWAFSLTVLGTGIWQAAERNRSYTLIYAGGASQGESFVLGQALATVVARYHPEIRIIVQETGGSSENLRLLAQRQAQLAVAQADVPTGPQARLVARLFADHFLLATRPAAGIAGFVDLKGRRIALPSRGGQYRSFLLVAAHFGLTASDFTFVGRDEAQADAAFLAGKADALFRVRALLNPAVARVVRAGQAKLLPIPQAGALQLANPAFEPATIPEGTYQGSPPLPSADLATIQVQRLLLAHQDIDPDAIRAIIEVLVEHRHELAAAIADPFAEIRPLLAQVAQQNTPVGLGPTLHPGVQSYFDRDKPSFVQENADYLALLLTVALLIGSWIAQLKQRVDRIRKNAADEYSKQVLALIRQARNCQDLVQLEAISEKLIAILTEAVSDLDSEKISEASFQSFRGLWQIASEVVRERRLGLAAAPLLDEGREA